MATETQAVSSWEREGYILDYAALQESIDQIQWYHDIEFPNGLKARSQADDADAHRKLWKWIRSELDKIDFAGKTVLDIGCWDGYWSFYAEQRGASRVLATDDATQNWAGNAGLKLAKALMRSGIETRTDVSIYEASKLKQRFDIILCLGVYYHLVDPFLGFTQVRHCAHEESVVVFEGDFAPDGLVQPELAAYLDLAGGLHCFVPTITCLRQMIQANYFWVKTQSTYHGHPWNRTLAVCRPFVGENPLHRYRPPSGLHLYDLRFTPLSPIRQAKLLRHDARVALRAGNRAVARRNFAKALRLQPFHLKAYRGLVKSLLP
jgi:tRNA (mo5U34)-methyltransferase